MADNKEYQALGSERVSRPSSRISRWRLRVPIQVQRCSTGRSPQNGEFERRSLTGPDGIVYADYEETNIAVVNYSEPVDETLSVVPIVPNC